MKKWKTLSVFLACTLALTACEIGSNSRTPVASSPGKRITELEMSGSIPRLDHANSIAGPDADNNGVRDDVDAYINTKYSDASQKAAVLQSARIIQKEILVDKTDKSALKLLALEEDRATHCLSLKFDFNGPNALKPTAVGSAVESVTTNTKERLLAYLAFSKAMDGTTAEIPSGNTCD